MEGHRGSGQCGYSSAPILCIPICSITSRGQELAKGYSRVAGRLAAGRTVVSIRRRGAEASANASEVIAAATHVFAAILRAVFDLAFLFVARSLPKP